MKKFETFNIESTNEIEIAKLRANYKGLHEGFFQKEADELRAKILNSPNTEDLYEINGTKYYVSAEGDDNNDGKTPKTAIKSLDAIEKLPLKEGDAVLFKRGDTFRFAREILAVDSVTYGSYGAGLKPKIYGSPENYAENDAWEEVKPNIWKIDFPYNYASGCTIDYGKIQGVQKWQTQLDGMSENGDYYHDLDNKVFYLYCDEGKPTDVYMDIEIMPTERIFFLKSSKDVTIDNLCLKYTASFAIHCPDMKNSATITNCEIGFVGGLWQGRGGPGTRVRFGNAIEFWSGLPGVVVENVTIKNNWIYQTYDSAITWQGNQDDTVWKNISFNENLFEYNNADIEFFGRDGAPLINFRMENNIMRFTSMGWGTRTNDGGIRGIEGCVRAVTTRVLPNVYYAMDIKDVYFINNKMDCPARQTINWNINAEQKKHVHASGTELYIKSEYRTLAECLQGLQDDWTVEKYDQRMATNKEELIAMFPRFENGAEIHWDE
ncbi:MAG: hypothetical protein IJD71_05340 [Clostridia bacterium]|nr:hypothetical protein [Clostridia bacterium]